MLWEQLVVFGTLVLALVLFVSGKWRYDIIALLALIIVGVTGIIPGEQIFSGFGHPAVITVAAVLVVSRALLNSGVVDSIARLLSRAGDHPTTQISALTGFTAASSGFMNNVGALALLMPVSIRMARKSNNPVSLILMPLAFASLLGGLVTLIGTPPNIIVAAFRSQTAAQAPFLMFDFAPVGIGVAAAGVAFISLIGWRLIPYRKGQASREELFDVDHYITEVLVPEKSPVDGKRLSELEAMTEDDLVVVGLTRGKQRIPAPSYLRKLRAGDILTLKADPEELQELLDVAGLETAGSRELGSIDDENALHSEEIILMETVVAPGSSMAGRNARAMDLRLKYGINLLGIARQGARLKARLGNIRLRAGDVLLLQGRTETLTRVLPELGCLPLAERDLRIGKPRRVLLGLGIFAAALITAALGLIPVPVAFVGAALLMVLTGLLSLSEVYGSIDWPIIVLLGAMIPVSQALEISGGADLIADSILQLAGHWPAWAALTLVLVATMFLSDLVNNAAAALLMAPIAAGVAQGIGASADPFLMSVAIGASCAFLTPIGHQSNTLVMGPGGYRFGDYWRMGLPLEVIIVIVAVPLILLFWPI